MKKITMLFILTYGIVSMQAQNFETIYTNGGTENYQSRIVTDWLHYDNGANANALGGSSAHVLASYIKLTSSILAAHINRSVEEIKFFMNDLAFTGDITIKILTSANGAPVYTQVVPHATVVHGWNTIALTTSYQITGSEFYIGYEYSMPGSHYGAGIDAGPGVADVNYLTWNGTWYELVSAGINANWNLQAGVGGATATNDCGISNVLYTEIIPATPQTISAEITNYGSTTLTSIDVNYTVDGGAPVTETLSGINLTTGQSQLVNFSTNWTPTLGEHIIDVYIGNFNGAGTDDIPQNDQREYTVRVYSNTTQRIPLFEEFTSSSCAPCASFNANTFNAAFLNQNTGHYNLIKYQMDWPRPGDPYYTAEGGVRRANYGVTTVPSLLLEGSIDLDTNLLQSELDEAYASPTYFVMASSYEIDASHNIDVEVDLTSYLGGNYTVHCVVVEKTTTGNATTNGETSFTNVMMKMVPNANGTAITVDHDTNRILNLSASLDGLHIEEWTDLEVIVFIQDDDNKVVYQSTKSVLRTASVDDSVFANVKLYPNPTTGSISIVNATDFNMDIVNVLGNVVYSKRNLDAIQQIDLSNLSNNIYFVRITDGQKTSIRKIMISK